MPLWPSKAKAMPMPDAALGFLRERLRAKAMTKR